MEPGMIRKFYILALDIGTSSLKAGLFDQNYNLILTDKVDYTYDTCGMPVSPISSPKSSAHRQKA